MIIFVLIVFTFDLPKVNSFMVIGLATFIVIFLYEVFGFSNDKNK